MTPRRRTIVRAIAALAIAPSLAAFAGPGDRPDLPAEAAAVESMNRHPLVDAARQGVRFQEANRDRLRLGPYEFIARAEADRRRARDPVAGYQEWTVTLERPVRLPGKAALDSAVGDAGVEIAELAVGDALHEVGRELLALWFGWVREASIAALWERQVELLREEERITQRRVEAGDASKLELNLAQAAGAQAASALAQSRAKAQAAAEALERRFPPVRATPLPPTVEPVMLEGDQRTWIEKITRTNHELAVARSQAMQQRLAARRAHAERMPDPSLGVRYTSERDNAERIAGVFVSVPLAGAAREAAARGASAQVDVLAGREAAVLRRVSAEAASAWTRSVGAVEAWRSYESAAARMRTNVELLQTGYRLGETPLADVLVGRRLAIETEIAALGNRLDAAEAGYRLLLDAHELWPLDVHADAKP